MIFQGLEIKQEYARQGDGNYKQVWIGKFHIKTENGSVLWVAVTPELCQQLINVCADHIVDTAEKACTDMKASILEAVAPTVLLQTTQGRE